MNQKRSRVPPSGPWPVSARMAARCSFVASTTGSWSVRTIVCVADGTTRPRCTFGINENGRPFLMEMVISLLQLQTKACTTRVGCEIWKSTTWRNYTARPPRMEKTALGISGTIAEQGRFKLDAADSPRRSSSRFSETSAPRLARRARETSATALVASAGTCVASCREAETELLHISLAAQAVHKSKVIVRSFSRPGRESYCRSEIERNPFVNCASWASIMRCAARMCACMTARAVSASLVSSASINCS